MTSLDKFISELNHRRVAYVRDGLTFKFNDHDVYLSSLTSLPEGVSLSAGGSLDLSSLTSLPEGVSLSAGGYLDLSSLTSLPEGVSLSAGGSLYLSSLTPLPEGVSLSAGGYLYLHSLTSEEQRYKGKKIRLRVVDHTVMRLISKRAAGNMVIWSAQYFKGHLDSDPRCWIAQDGDTYSHGDTPEAAMLDLRFKVAQRDLDPAELVAQIKARGTIQFNDYRLLTGACAEGLRQGLKDRGLDPDLAEMPLETALKLCKGAYGGDTFARLMAVA